MPLDFVAIDFETANPKRASVIQIGLAKVRDGKIINSTSKMVTPPRDFRNFHERNIRVHGLTPKDMYGAPGWPAILDRLIRYTGALPLVAHNAAFERSVIQQASEAENLIAPDFPYLCTHKLAKDRMPELANHRLDTVVAGLGLPAFDHHDAGDDAVACASLVMALAERTGFQDLEDLWPPVKAYRR